jgi:sugar O-acyltransferase (sialic acid O-acetyltransferase NeuD family)
MEIFDEITLVGFTESHFLMINEILESIKLTPKLNVFDNQNRYNSETLSQTLNFINNLESYKNYVFCFAKPKSKKLLYDLFNLEKGKFINLIHSSSKVSNYSNIGVGLRIEPYSYVAPKTKIGDFVNINRNVSIGHHCNISNYVSINPGCNISSNVIIGQCSEICVGSTIIDGIEIGKNTIIGAGSVVTKNIPDNVIAYGNPCKIIRTNE